LAFQPLLLFDTGGIVWFMHASAVAVKKIFSDGALF
jgi:hypothetical protein